MQISQTFSYRHAESILSSEYRAETQEIREVIAAAHWVRKPEVKVRTRNERVVATLSIDQIGTNSVIEDLFRERGWIIRPRIVSHAGSHLAADFKKNAIQVEVQFGNMARWYTDVFKFLLSYAANDIEIGVLIVPMQKVAQKIDENTVYFERVHRELPHAKMAITIPVWVIGLGEK
jgi:hypothetical protein